MEGYTDTAKKLTAHFQQSWRNDVLENLYTYLHKNQPTNMEQSPSCECDGSSASL